MPQKAGLVDLEKSEFSCTCREWNDESLAFEHVAKTLYWLLGTAVASNVYPHQLNTKKKTITILKSCLAISLPLVTAFGFKPLLNTHNTYEIYPWGSPF